MVSACHAYTLSILLFTLFCYADEQMLVQNKEYNDGDFGEYPTHIFRTSSIEPPRLNFMKPFTYCDDGSYIFVAPRGEIAWSAFYILDAYGSLVWGPDHRYGEVYNFQVQTYKGEQYLVFWAGDDSIGGHGEGKYYMLNKHYEEHRQISAGGGIRGDLHAFDITPDETAVFTAYEAVQHDLSNLGGPVDGWIWESMFQELDIDRNKVIFQWRASEHFDLRDVFVYPNQATREDPWDFFHINMVEKDTKGNYLVSTRYGRCALYISGETGETLWQLGGKNNNFTDLSDGEPTTFLGQHDIHWAREHKAITMFDNRADWSDTAGASRGIRISIDLDNMSANLTNSYTHPEHITSFSQGSYQTLPNGNVLLGFGFNGVFTEYAVDGTVLCDAYMQPSSQWGSGNVQSYRNLKFDWTGIPLTSPKVALDSEMAMLFISWLGSTEARKWVLQDCDSAEGPFRSVQSTDKVGFETKFSLAGGKRMRKYVRAIAVDDNGTQLAVSDPVDLVDPSGLWPEEDEGEGDEDFEGTSILYALGIFAAVCVVLVTWMSFGGRWVPSGIEDLSNKLQSQFRSFLDGIRSRRNPRSSWRDDSATLELLSNNEEEEVEDDEETSHLNTKMSVDNQLDSGSFQQ